MKERPQWSPSSHRFDENPAPDDPLVAPVYEFIQYLIIIQVPSSKCFLSRAKTFVRLLITRFF